MNKEHIENREMADVKWFIENIETKNKNVCKSCKDKDKNMALEEKLVLNKSNDPTRKNEYDDFITSKEEVTPFTMMESSRIQQDQTYRPNEDEEEAELLAKRYSPFFVPPELDADKTEQLGKIFIETIKQLDKSRRTKAFVLRRFKSKRNKSFKPSPFGESKYEMIAKHADWAEKERKKCEIGECV